MRTITSSFSALLPHMLPEMLLGCLLAACGSMDDPLGDRPHIPGYGMASGDVTPRSAVLWTRAEAPGMLTVQVARDPAFEDPVLERTAEARAEDDLTAEVEVRALAPDTAYFYRWIEGEQAGATGTFRTAPLPGARAPVRLAFSGDSDGILIDGEPYFNDFEVLDAIRRDAPAAFVYLGDTIYGDSSTRRRLTGQEPARTLDEYRALYRENRQLGALRALMATTSTYAIWDDHEVRNDYDGQTVDPERYASGREAFLEYMPVSERMLLEDPRCAGAPLFRVFHWGQLADVIILDERSCRSASVEDICQDDPAPTLPALLRVLVGLSPAPPEGCLEAIRDPERTFLGKVQTQAFKEALAGSRAQYKLVVSEIPIQQLFLLPYDRMEGYEAERREILTFIRDRGIDNVVFLATDIHANLIGQVAVDHFRDAERIAWELVAGPIATRTFQQVAEDEVGPGGAALAHALLTLAGVKCRHLDAYGYGLVDVDPDSGTARIALKDDTGKVLEDQRLGGTPCAMTLGK